MKKNIYENKFHRLVVEHSYSKGLICVYSLWDNDIQWHGWATTNSTNSKPCSHQMRTWNSVWKWTWNSVWKLTWNCVCWSNRAELPQSPAASVSALLLNPSNSENFKGFFLPSPIFPTSWSPPPFVWLQFFSPVSILSFPHFCSLFISIRHVAQTLSAPGKCLTRHE